jgi:hypothetical protein
MQDMANVFISKYVEEATGEKKFCPVGQEFEFVDRLSSEIMEKRDSSTYFKLSTALAALFIFVDEIDYAKKIMNKYGWPERDEWEQMKTMFALELMSNRQSHMRFCMKSPLLAALLTINSERPKKMEIIKELIAKKELDPMKKNSLELSLAVGLCKQLGETGLIAIIEDKLKG